MSSSECDERANEDRSGEKIVPEQVSSSMREVSKSEKSEVNIGENRLQGHHQSVQQSSQQNEGTDTLERVHGSRRG